MRAIIQDAYGPPDVVLTVQDIAKPSVGDSDVLVRVHAVPVAGDDWHLVQGLPYLARVATGLRKPKSRVTGLQMAGTVEAVGAKVVDFLVGEEVFGWCAGAFAEYVAVPEGQLAHKPINLSLEEAAAVPISAFTALQGVRDGGRLKAGQSILITGASGGVGIYAVQIAKAYGAEVTGVCSTAKVDLVHSLGADHVIDYTKEHFSANGKRYDVVLDIYGNSSLSQCRRALKPGGVLVFIGGTGGRWFMGVDRWLRGLLVSPFLGVKMRPLIHKDSHADLLVLRELIESGEVRPVIDRTYPMSAIAQAIADVKAGRTRGQVVVAVATALKPAQAMPSA